MKYTSPPLEQDLTIAGDVMLVLYASTDVRDTIGGSISVMSAIGAIQFG